MKISGACGKLKKAAGFTLIELVMVMVVASVLSLFIADFLFYEINNYTISTATQQSIQNSNWALETLAKDLRQITTSDSILYAASDSIQFYDVASTLITYRFAGGEITRLGDPLLNSVTSFSFSYYDNGGDEIDEPVSDTSEIKAIEIDFKVSSNGRVYTFKTRVQPRNL